MTGTDSLLALHGGRPVREAPWPPHTIIGEEERREVAQVLDSAILSGFVARAGDHFLGGPRVRAFEEEFAKYFGIAHAVSMNSATSCLHAALLALGCRSGDEVVVTPYTMSASATAVLMCNSAPFFADVDPVYGNLDPFRVAAAITPRTKALVVVHLFGHPAPMDELLAISKANNLPIVEDCAQAPAASYRGRLAGTMGAIGVFSFNQFKTVTCGEGGVSITADPSLALRMQLTRNHAECIVEDMSPKDSDIVGFNYRLTELNAAVAAAQFRKLDRLTEHRIRLADYLTRRLSGFPGLGLPRTAEHSRHVYFLYPIRFDEGVWEIRRDQFVQALNAEGLPFGGGYTKPLHLLPIFHGVPGTMPVAERLHSREIVTTMLCRFPLGESDMDQICAAIEKVWKGRDQFRDGTQ